jgi:hypothetical protein
LTHQFACIAQNQTFLPHFYGSLDPILLSLLLHSFYNVKSKRCFTKNFDKHSLARYQYYYEK